MCASRIFELTFGRVFDYIRRRLSRGDEHNETQTLAAKLQGYQIFFLALSGILGSVILFTTNGMFIRSAGPGGFLIAIVFVGVTAVLVSEGSGTLVVHFPVLNGMAEYVRVFVDEDLAVVVSVGYLYTWASVIFTMLVAAANLTTYWDLDNLGQILLFYVLSPIVLAFINWLDVQVYGRIEAFFGILKFCFVLGAAFFLIAIGTRYGKSNLHYGFQFDPDLVDSPGKAFLLIIPFLTYGFIGIESVSVTAFEAQNPRTSLRWSCRLIAPIVFILFLLVGVGEALCFAWQELPQLKSGDVRLERRASFERTSSILVMAALRENMPRFAGFLVGCLIFCLLSAANTAVYIASRQVYGLTRDLHRSQHAIFRWFSWLAYLDPRTRAPFFGIIVSMAAFCWLPAIHSLSGYSNQELFEVMSTVGSVGGVLVWASQCLAYIRWHHWSNLHRDLLLQLADDEPQNYAYLDRWRSQNRHIHYHSLIGPAQPLPAYLGLVLCLLIVFVFGSVTWWDKPATVKKVAIAFAGPIALFSLWVLLKFVRVVKNEPKKPIWIRLDDNADKFRKALHYFHSRLHLRDPLPRQEPTHPGTGINPGPLQTRSNNTGVRSTTPVWPTVIIADPGGHSHARTFTSSASNPIPPTIEGTAVSTTHSALDPQVHSQGALGESSRFIRAPGSAQHDHSDVDTLQVPRP